MDICLQSLQSTILAFHSIQHKEDGQIKTNIKNDSNSRASWQVYNHFHKEVQIGFRLISWHLKVNSVSFQMCYQIWTSVMNSITCFKWKHIFFQMKTYYFDMDDLTRKLQEQLKEGIAFVTANYMVWLYNKIFIINLGVYQKALLYLLSRPLIDQ